MLRKYIYASLGVGLLLIVPSIAEAGLRVNGVGLNGLSLNGANLNGTSFQGTALNANQITPSAIQGSVRVEGGQLAIQTRPVSK